MKKYFIIIFCCFIIFSNTQTAKAIEIEGINYTEYTQSDFSEGISVPTGQQTFSFTAPVSAYSAYDDYKPFSFILSSATAGGAYLQLIWDWECCMGGTTYTSTLYTPITDQGIYSFSVPYMSNVWHNETFATPPNRFTIRKMDADTQLTIYGATIGGSFKPAVAINQFFGWTDYINSTISPALNAVLPATVAFTGTYSNGGGADKIILMLEDITHSQSLSFIYPLPPLSVYLGTYNFSQALQVNTEYTYQVKLWNTGTDTYSDPSVSSGFATNADPLNTGLSGYTQQECGIDNITGCFTNALNYLFYPTTNSYSELLALKDNIKNKPPIGYITGIFSTLGELSYTGDPTLSFATFTPLTTYIFDPLKTGLSVVLWLAFAFVIFKRFQHFQL